MNLKINSISELKQAYRDLGLKGVSKINKKTFNDYLSKLKDKSEKIDKPSKSINLDGWDGYMNVIEHRKTNNDILNKYIKYINVNIKKCDLNPIKDAISVIIPTDFEMVKVNTEIKSNFNCKMVIKKILLIQTNTAVFVVDMYIDKKIIPKVVKITTAKSKQIQREERIHTQTKGDIYQFITTPIKIGNKVFNGVIMDYLGKPINSNIDKKQIFFLILKELEKLHKNNILHEDVKPDNILYDEITNRINIIDFGLSQIITDKLPYSANGGTPSYSSPYIDIHKILSKTYRETITQRIPDSYYKDSKDIKNNELIFSVRAFDDMISLIYIFISFYADNMVSKFIRDITEYDKKFIKKYGNRKYIHFKTLRPSNIVEEVYKMMFNYDRIDKNNILRPVYLESSQKAKFINGSQSKDILNKVLSGVRVLYKLKYLKFSKLKTKLPDWFIDFLSPYKHDIFEVDIEYKIKKLVKICNKYKFKNMSKSEIEKVVQNYPEFYNPLYNPIKIK